jgi:hypothetical protein
VPWGGEISREALIAITKHCNLIWIKSYDPLSNQGHFDSGSKISKDWPARRLGADFFDFENEALNHAFYREASWPGNCNF